MKSKQKMTPLYALTLILALPSLSFATGWSQQASISSIGTNSGLILVHGVDSSNPDACIVASPLIVTPDTVNYSETYALLVASFLQGKSVEVYFNGCTTAFGHTYPKITAVNSYY